MDPVIVAEDDLIANQTSQVGLVPCDDVVEDLAAAASDPALRSPVLPWLCVAKRLYSIKMSPLVIP